MGVLDDYAYQKRTDASAKKGKIIKIDGTGGGTRKTTGGKKTTGGGTTGGGSRITYSSGGGGGGGGGSSKTTSTTSSTTTNNTKQSDATKERTLRELVDMLSKSATGQASQLEIDLNNMGSRLAENVALAQSQYDKTLGTMQEGYGAQLGVLNDIQGNTEKALAEEGTTTNTEYGRMANELKQQTASLGVGETGDLTARIMGNLDRMITSNQSLRGAFDTTASTNQAKETMRTDALSGANDLGNRLDSEMSELDAAYESDANNRANASYATQADLYKQIGSAWNQQALDVAKARDEAKGQKVKSTTKSKSGGYKSTSKDTATYKIKTSMSEATAKKLQAESAANATAALKTAGELAGKTSNIKTDLAVGTKSDWKPEAATTELKTNLDINTGQAETKAGKRVSGSTLKGWG